MKPKLVNLNDLLTSFIAELRKMLHADATLQLTTAADLWLTEVDAKQFQIAIRHLTENAGEAMPKDGTFRLETSNCHLSRPLHDGAEDVYKRQEQMHKANSGGSWAKAHTQLCARQGCFDTTVRKMQCNPMQHNPAGNCQQNYRLSWVWHKSARLSHTTNTNPHNARHRQV